MKIQLIGKHKSLSDFECDGLNGLCVITGKNGSGKTQFLELFKLDNPSATRYKFNIIPHLNNAQIQIEGLNFLSITSVNKNIWNNSVDQIIAQIGFEPFALNLISAISKKVDEFSTLQKSDFIALFDSQQLIVKNGIYGKVYGQNWDRIKENLSEGVFDWFKINDRAVDTYISVAKFFNKDVTELNRADFFVSSIHERSLSAGNLFQTRFEEILYNYSKRRHDNHYHWFRKNELNAVNNAVSDFEFLKTNRKPWDTINEILSHHNIDYHVTGIDSDKFIVDFSYSYKFIKNDTNIEVDFQDLSSGEKTIITLIIKLFLNSYYDGKLQYPELLILDEPDAFLHPEMSKLLIEVLEESFVKKLNITVIMTTHSPSTVALAPDDSIWEIKNSPKTILQRTTKDDALQVLTNNIPTLSIDYKSHRQVFVESPTDLEYYQLIHSRLSIDKSLTHKLYFLSLGHGKGNCDTVAKFVSDFRTSGNKTVYGIIDWDNKNKTRKEEYVWVHGETMRYSIENYILDPIYLVSYFLNEGNANNVRENLNFRQAYSEYAIGNEDQERLQEIADWCITLIEQANNFSISEKERTQVKYYNEKVLMYPIWLLKSKGHGLFEKVKKAFPSLRDSKRDEKYHIKKMSMIAAKCFPFIAEETINLFFEIGN